MKTQMQIRDGEQIRNVNMKDFFYGVVEIIEALIEGGDQVLATNIILEKDYDLDDLEEFINQHPIASDDLKEFITKLKEEYSY